MFWHLVGNRFLSLCTSVLFNTTLRDVETGGRTYDEGKKITWRDGIQALGVLLESRVRGVR